MALLREGAEQVDYLVLCDSPLVLDAGGWFTVVADDRLDVAMADLRRTVATMPDGADRAARFRQAVRV